MCIYIYYIVDTHTTSYDVFMICIRDFAYRMYM